MHEVTRGAVREEGGGGFWAKAAAIYGKEESGRRQNDRVREGR